MDVKIKIEDLGYDESFETNRVRLGLDNLRIARVIAEYKGAYRVKNVNGEYLAKITGKQMFIAASREDFPAVGDWVSIKELDSEHALIYAVLPRKTIIKRRYGNKNRNGEKDKTQIIATNIDVAFIVESLDRDYNLNRFERYLAIVRNSGIKPAIILNKIDLISKEELDKKLAQIKSRLSDINVISTSIANEGGLNELERYITSGKTYCFLGSSGVGKSSLINKLIGGNVIKTGGISSYSGRGKHITTTRQMYFLKSGGIVIDNPGIREVGMTNVNEGIDSTFDEIAGLAQKCKYVDCTHTREPGCEVLASVKSGKLDEEKYSNYLNLKKEAEYYEMNDIERKEKDREFGKFINRAKKELKRFGHKS